MIIEAGLYPNYLTGGRDRDGGADRSAARCALERQDEPGLRRLRLPARSAAPKIYAGRGRRREPTMAADQPDRDDEAPRTSAEPAAADETRQLAMIAARARCGDRRRRDP